MARGPGFRRWWALIGAIAMVGAFVFAFAINMNDGALDDRVDFIDH